MTNEQDTDPRFAWISQHGGPAVGWVNSSRHTVAGTGLTGWHASDRSEENKPAEIHKHSDGDEGLRMQGIYLSRHAPPGEGPVRWTFTLKISDGRYVRASGAAVDFPTALAQVESHAFESRQMGGLTWWCESAEHWLAWLGPFNLSATKIVMPSKGTYWSFQVQGEASTLEEAALLASLGRANIAGALGS